MKILFLVPSLSLGKSGVADYTIGLADALASMGVECRLASLSEGDLLEMVEEVQCYGFEGKAFNVLRLPSCWGWGERIDALKLWMGEDVPDWVSLQFVAYGFHPRGLLYRLGRHFRSIPANRWHVMFHEIWVGAHQGAGFQQKAVGLVQRFFIKILFRQLKIASSHTSNVAYTGLLNKNGFSTKILPLFGAVPCLKNVNSMELFLRLFPQKSVSDRPGFVLFGIFGALHLIWPPEPLLSSIREAMKQTNRRGVIISLGQIGVGKKKWEEIQLRYQEDFDFFILGNMSADALASAFSGLDYGISTTPYQVLGKSSSVASLLEHGLPVLVNRQEFFGLTTDHDRFPDDLAVLTDLQSVELLKRGIARRIAQSSREKIAKQFLSELGQVGIEEVK